MAHPYSGYVNPIAGGHMSAVAPLYPAVGGQPVMMGYNPKRYSGKFLRKFYNALILSQIANTEYEGEIKDCGDSVIIRTTPDINIYNYVNGQTLKYETYATDYVTLNIDRGKWWGFTTRTVEFKQTDLKKFVNEWTTNAALMSKTSIERDVFGEIFADASALNSGETAGRKSGLYNMGTAADPLTLKADTVVEFITKCASVLDEQDIPNEERYMIIPMWMSHLLINSGIIKANEMGDSTSVLRRGQDKVGNIDRFDIFRSNCLANGVSSHSSPSSVTYTNVIFGHKSALTFAGQLTENEVLPNPNGFGKLHRGLTVFGFKVVLPQALGHAVVTPLEYSD